MQVDPSSAPRVVELDALRGLAALAVVGYHFTTRYDELYGHVGGPLPSLAFGNFGVNLFFLISGFVIFMTLERTRNPLDFVVARFSRLFPAYWAAILLSAAFVYTIGMSSQRLPWTDVALDFTMIQEVLGGEHLDGSYWTLGVELFFYLQMLLWFCLGQLKRIQWIVLGWLVLAVACGLAAKHDRHFSYLARELLILRHIPFFAIGILFYRRHAQAPGRGVDLALIALAIAAIGVAYPPVYFAVALVCTAIFALLVGGRLVWLRWRPFVFLGAISYPLYLLHQAIGYALIWHFERFGIDAGVSLLLAMLVVLVLAVLLTFLVERPAQRWIRRVWKGRRERPRQPLVVLAAGVIPLLVPEVLPGERRGAAPAALAVATAPLGRDEMTEPHRSAFAAMIRAGASSRDIHDAAAGTGFAAECGHVDDAYLQREIDRVETHRQRMLPLLEMHLGATASILDIGCNTGGTTLALALSERLAAREVVGVDPNHAALDAARVRLLGHGLDPARVRFEAIEAGRLLPFADGHFDLVTIVSVFEFVGSAAARTALAGEIQRVTRSGGHIFVATPNPWRLRELHTRRWFGDLRRRQGFPWASSPAAIQRMFDACDEVPIARDLASRLCARHGLPDPGIASALVVAAMPWQKHLYRRR